MAAATTQIDPKRLARIKKLYSGSHSASQKQMCAMEAVAFVAGEPWSDHPQCASKVIGAFMRSWNDGISDADERTALLLPLIPRLVDTAASPAVEERRAYMAVDWFIRTNTPAWLRLAGLTRQADLIASLPEITGMAQIPSIRAPLEVVCDDAQAARSAARSAAESAAWSAAESAARSAARSAAESAARSAARSAAESAAWSAARSAAWSAAWSALATTKAELQQSAVALVERMIDAEEHQEAA